MKAQVYHDPNVRSRGIFRFLTPKEKQVSRLVALQYSNKEIANLLGIKPSTVIRHVLNIRKKRNVKSRIGLVPVALVEKVVTLDELSADFPPTAA